MAVVDYTDPKFIFAVEQILLKVLKTALDERSPESQVALLLYELIKDFERFRSDIDARLVSIDSGINVLDSKLADLGDKVFTKGDWDSERIRLLKGIGELFKGRDPE